KSLMANSPASDKLMLTFFHMGLLHGTPINDDKVILPQEIKTSHLLSYSNLSKSCFYKDLHHLKITNQIEKQDKTWIIYNKELNAKIRNGQVSI
ncbi:Crp/Fnr family transcriptional regulator, partial [Listeria monocytogenes]